MFDPLITLAAARRRLQHTPADISSSSNPKWRHLRELLESARERRRSGQTVLEGWHLLDAWLATGRPIRQLVIPQRTLQQLAGVPASDGDDIDESVEHSSPVQVAADAHWLILDDRLFGELDLLPSPSPVLAVVDIPQRALPARLGEGGDIIVLDRVQDPGNVGAILRTAAAAGVQTLLTTPGTAACWAPKVLRAGMGGHFVLDIVENVAPEALQALAAHLPLAGTVLQGGQSLYGTDLRSPLAWVFGNEGEGIAPALQERLGLRLTIPQAAGVESLNVAASAAVCLFEQRRQRLV
jgi:putative RNA methyltransferase